MNPRATRWLVPVIFLSLTPLLYNNCAGGFHAANSSSSTMTAAPISTPLAIVGNEANVLPVTIGCGYTNEPCVSVTVCQPGGVVGSSQCVTIPDVLVDTGSVGLRIFANLLPFSLAYVPDPVSGHPAAECYPFADGVSDWGPLARADVVLGNGQERAANIPVQLIDAAYAQTPTDCSNPETTPNTSGYNAILGVGLQPIDCGTGCTSDGNIRVYYACNGTACNSIALPEASQMVNPVAALPHDNNGIALQLPNLGTFGAPSASGYMILGIGTESDNVPASGVTMLTASAAGDFQSDFNGQFFPLAFIDSGSNANYFPDTSLAPCTEQILVGLYCPSAVTMLTGQQVNSSGSVEVAVPFQAASASVAYNANNYAVPSFAGSASDYFDWGLPFFFGRTVYVGIEGTTSPLGTGPYWAF